MNVNPCHLHREELLSFYVTGGYDLMVVKRRRDDLLPGDDVSLLLKLQHRVGANGKVHSNTTSSIKGNTQASVC